MNGPDVLAQVAGELRKECSCVVGGPNHGQCLNCDLSDRIETARAAVAELIETLEGLMPERVGFGNSLDHYEHAKGIKAARAALARCKGESP